MKISAFGAVMVMVGVCAFAETSVPPLVNYQGKLTDAQGNPLTGQHKLVFNIYDAAMGGTAVWGPQEFAAVPVVGGQFNVILGTTDKTGKSLADAFAEKDRYLGVTMDSGAEIAPRQQILSTPFAIQAQRASSADALRSFFGNIVTVLSQTVTAGADETSIASGTAATDGFLLATGRESSTAFGRVRAVVENQTRGIFETDYKNTGIEGGSLIVPIKKGENWSVKIMQWSGPVTIMWIPLQQG